MVDITQVSDPQAVITFFSACVTAYAIIIGLTNIYIIYNQTFAGMEYLKGGLLLFSISFFFIFIVILFVPPTPFESVRLIARIAFLFAVFVTIYITWQIPKKTA